MSSTTSNCFFTKLITWKDPNLSAAFLTVGNAVVLLVLLAGDALSWLQFFIVYGVLPLGLVARLTGLDRSVQFSESSSAMARSYYEAHFYANLKGLGLVRLGVYLLILAQLIAVFGVPLMVGIVGNAVMLVPLLWAQFGSVVVSTVKQIPIESVVSVGKQVYAVGIDTVAGLGPLAPAAVAGAGTFFGILLGSQLLTADYMVVLAMRLVGYGIVVLFALLPVASVEKIVAQIVPSPARVESISRSFKVTEWAVAVKDVVLWENYPHSITAFVALYTIYFVSSFTGVGFLVAVGAGFVAAFHQAPMVYKEKVAGKLDQVVKNVVAKIPVNRFKAGGTPKIKPVVTKAEAQPTEEPVASVAELLEPVETINAPEQEQVENKESE